MGLKFKITGWMMFVLSVLVIFGSHIWILIFGLTPDQVDAHAVINIVAGFFIVSGMITILTGRRMRR